MVHLSVIKLEIMNKGKLVSLIILAILVIGLVVYGAVTLMNKDAENTEVATEGEVVATVNGVEITRAAYDAGVAAAIESFRAQGVDVDDETNKTQIEAQTLEDLINNEVVDQAVAASGITATAAEIEEQFEIVKTQAGDEFANQLDTANLTEEGLRENIRAQITLQKFLTANVDVASITATDAEIEALYQQAVDAGQEVPPLEEVRDQVSQQIVQTKQQQAINAFVQTLRSAADVVTLL